MNYFHPFTDHPEEHHRGHVSLGRTLPSLLDEACDHHPNRLAFNQWSDGAWQSWSNERFRHGAEEVALGLQGWGLQKGDHLALFMNSDVHFCLLDMGSLLANLVNVPIHLNESPEHIAYILNHAEVRAIAVSDLRLLRQLVPHLGSLPHLKMLIIGTVPEDWQTQLTSLPAHLQVMSLDGVRACGRSANRWQRQHLRSGIAPGDLATIIYTASPGGNPLGVMLSHENIAANILAAFGDCAGVETGDREVVLSYLPLSHVFARAFLYGHINYGHSVYFIAYKQLPQQLSKIRPTILLAVPLVLEKLRQKLVLQSDRLPLWQRRIFEWGLTLATHYQVGHPINRWAQGQRWLADQLIYRHWRAALGGRLKFLICGGAALDAELTNLFCGAGITVLQGYGLTEASSVVAYNRVESNHPGTVGLPILEVEVQIAEDGEILVRSPYVMQGYYQDRAATQAAIDEDGWLHTGDLGTVTEDGCLQVTDCKKPLFKLSTGKYVTPRPLEEQFQASPLVHQAVAVGAHRPFCTLLVVPEGDRLKARAKAMGLGLPLSELLSHPAIIGLYQDWVDQVNRTLPAWSAVRRFQLIDQPLTEHNGLLDAQQQIQRAKVRQQFAAEITALYAPNFPTNCKVNISIPTEPQPGISLNTELAT